jgi:hypothetical protein
MPVLEKQDLLLPRLTLLFAETCLRLLSPVDESDKKWWTKKCLFHG